MLSHCQSHEDLKARTEGEWKWFCNCQFLSPTTGWIVALKNESAFLRRAVFSSWLYPICHKHGTNTCCWAAVSLSHCHFVTVYGPSPLNIVGVQQMVLKQRNKKYFEIKYRYYALPPEIKSFRTELIGVCFTSETGSRGAEKVTG